MTKQQLAEFEAKARKAAEAVPFRREGSAVYGRPVYR